MYYFSFCTYLCRYCQCVTIVELLLEIVSPSINYAIAYFLKAKYLVIFGEKTCQKTSYFIQHMSKESTATHKARGDPPWVETWDRHHQNSTICKPMSIGNLNLVTLTFFFAFLLISNNWSFKCC